MWEFDKIAKGYEVKKTILNVKMPTYRTKYTLDKKPLGIGGAACVYGCTRMTDGEHFAIKILTDRHDCDKIERFKREIDVVKNIESNQIDGVLPILDADKDDLWYVMPLAKSLRHVIDDFVMMQKNASPVTTYQDDILRQIIGGFINLAKTFGKIHSLGYVHRDIKPDNLYIWNDKYYIGDFGIVDLPIDVALTKKQDRLGAWTTIAPEVLRDSRMATDRSDVYSLAKTLWMCLTLKSKGFDGRYDYNASSMSLHDVPHLQNAFLLDIDELLYEATQEDSNLRPSMLEFAEYLNEWQKSLSDFELMNRKEWSFIYKALFSGVSMPIIEINDIRDIAKILHYFARYTHLNYTMMPQSGGLTLNDSSLSPEEGCIYLDFGFLFVCKPQKLILRNFNDDETWNYVFLELSELKPVLTDCEEEELVEDTPAHYVDGTNAVYGVYDYESGEKLPVGWKKVVRVCKGNFLIVAKSGFYNSITSASDGRHSNFTEGDFFQYISEIRTDVDRAKICGYNLESIRRKYSHNPKLLSGFIENEIDDAKQDKCECNEHWEDLSFADLLDDVGDGYAKYHFTFDPHTCHSPFDFYNDLYLCKDGKIRELDENNDGIFYAYDRKKALLLLERINKRLFDRCNPKVVRDPLFEPWANVHCQIWKTPTHLFTYRELNNAILSADDRKDNVVCIDEDGYIVVSSDEDYHIYPVSYARFGAYKNYVGPYSKDTAKYIVKDLRSLFLQYLKTGIEARYSEDEDGRDIKDIVEETKKLLAEMKR